MSLVSYDLLFLMIITVEKSSAQCMAFLAKEEKKCRILHKNSIAKRLKIEAKIHSLHTHTREQKHVFLKMICININKIVMTHDSDSILVFISCIHSSHHIQTKSTSQQQPMLQLMLCLLSSSSSSSQLPSGYVVLLATLLSSKVHLTCWLTKPEQYNQFLKLCLRNSYRKQCTHSATATIHYRYSIRLISSNIDWMHACECGAVSV